MRRGIGVVLAVVLLAPVAHAQDASTLFQQGLAAYQRGDTAAACGLFERSYKAEAATGTLFNLATCHAKERRFWEARGEFLKLAGQMDREDKADKAKIARVAAAATEAELPKLKFVFPDSSSSNVEKISIDGEVFAAEKVHAPIVVARGLHLVVFAAEGMSTAEQTIDAMGVAAITVHVPVLSLQALPDPAGATTNCYCGAPGIAVPRDTRVMLLVAAAGVFWVALRRRFRHSNHVTRPQQE